MWSCKVWEMKVWRAGCLSISCSLSPHSAISSSKTGTVTVLWANACPRAQDSVKYVVGTQ